ncbi:unnamed protein product [Blepharisma stoltei]|uniref:Transmembrane protein n=1 Tax=Blepharisma stoltei TaxID=1481888 RepID=A0AAU9JB41_9CILI|nr:unnamed protein product [Blepharisma stoltei]
MNGSENCGDLEDDCWEFKDGMEALKDILAVDFSWVVCKEIQFCGAWAVIIDLGMVVIGVLLFLFVVECAEFLLSRGSRAFALQIDVTICCWSSEQLIEKREKCWYD